MGAVLEALKKLLPGFEEVRNNALKSARKRRADSTIEGERDDQGANERRKMRKEEAEQKK